MHNRAASQRMKDMSAPQTDPEKQAKRHRPSLLAIAIVVAFALVLLFALITVVVDRGGAPQGADEQIDGRTGDVIEQQ